MKLKNDFVVQSSNGESILIPSGKAGFAGIVRGNKTFGAILELLQEETSENEIVSAMTKRFDAPEETIRRDVQKALAQLEKIGAIDG